MHTIKVIAQVSDKVSVEGAVDIRDSQAGSGAKAMQLARGNGQGGGTLREYVLRMCYGITDRHRGSVGGAGHRGVVLAAARALCVPTRTMMWQ